MKRELVFRLVFLVTTIQIIVVAGCEFRDPVTLNSVTNESYNLAKTSAFSVQMDEKRYTFDLQVPPGMELKDKEDFYLLGYQNVRTTISIDEEGYFARDVQFLEGDEHIQMPQDLWDATKDSRPADFSPYAAVNQITMSNGKLKRISPAGVVSSSDYDAEAFRVAPQMIDSLYIVGCDTCTEMVGKRRIEMENDEIPYAMINDFCAVIDYYPQNPALEKISTAVDLRTGPPFKTAYYVKGGDLSAFEYSHYQIIDGYPVMDGSIIFNFGDVEGSWMATSVTISDRTNFSVNRAHH